MPRWRTIAGVSLLVVGFAALVVAWFSYQQTFTPAATTVPSASSSLPSEEPLPSVVVPDTPIPTTTPEAADIQNPRGKPESLTIKRGAKTVVETMPFAPRVINRDDPGKFASRCGGVAYWDNSGWPKPGVESLNKALVTGHVMCGDKWYPLQYLQPTEKNGKEVPGGRKGDLLYIQYSSGDLVIAEAKEDSRNLEKLGPESPNEDPAYMTNDGKMVREIRLTTCDRTSVIREDGHAKYNVVQRFRVITVIRAKSK